MNRFFKAAAVIALLGVLLAAIPSYAQPSGKPGGSRSGPPSRAKVLPPGVTAPAAETDMPATPAAPAAPASQPYTGSFGPDTAQPAADAAAPATGGCPPQMPCNGTAEQPPSTVPPVMQGAPLAPAPAPAPQAQQQPAAPADPCAAYMGSYDAYAFCQDRIKKIERMKEAKGKRAESAKAYQDKRNPKAATPAPAAAPAAPAPAAPAPAADGAAPATAAPAPAAP